MRARRDKAPKRLTPARQTCPHPEAAPLGIVVARTGFGAWSRERLDFVMLHECAHIHRRYWIGALLARTADAWMFWHPGTRAITQWLSLEREHRCDALVAAQTKRPRAYVKTLLLLKRNDR